MIFPSQARKESMALAFAELDKVANPVICEVGRLRSQYAGESDGHSTLAFLSYLNIEAHDGLLVSIDKNIETESVCRNLLVGQITDVARVCFLNADAIEIFYDGGVTDVDLLYLDGWDLNDPESAKKHLTCFMLAEPLVRSGGLVLIDDTGISDLGKGKLVVPVAKLIGWEVLHQGFQTLLRKPI